jgi:hypothetical protein
MKRINEAAARPDREPEHLPSQEGDADRIWGTAPEPKSS